MLGHELAHVIQQRQGRVRAPSGSGLVVVRDLALEREADQAALRLMQAGPTPPGASVAVGRPVGVIRAGYGTIQTMKKTNLQLLNEFLEEQGVPSDDSASEDEDDGDYNEEPPGRPSKPQYLYQDVYGPAPGQVTLGKTIYDAYACNQTTHHQNCKNRKNKVLVIVGKSGKQMSPVGSQKREQCSPICHIIPWALVEPKIEKYRKSVNNFEHFRKFMCWGNLSNLEPGYYRCNSKSGTQTRSKKSVATYVKEMKDEYDNNVKWPDYLVSV